MAISSIRNKSMMERPYSQIGKKGPNLDFLKPNKIYHWRNAIMFSDFVCFFIKTDEVILAIRIM